jgi:integrase
MAGSDAMKDLRAGIVDYLDLRRSLGFKLKTDERLLLDFAAFMERCGATRITSKLALAWAQRPETTDPNYLAGRLRAIRSFARYRILMDARTEIPPTDLLPRQRSAFQPHIFHQEEIARLLAASLQRRRGAKPISRWSRYAIFGLLSVTGMRVGEALNLDLEDVDLDHGVLTIRNAKFGKSRLVPVHATTCAALKLYLEQRNAFMAGRSATPFFISPLETTTYCPPTSDRGTDLLSVPSAVRRGRAYPQAIRPPWHRSGCHSAARRLVRIHPRVDDARIGCAVQSRRSASFFSRRLAHSTR